MSCEENVRFVLKVWFYELPKAILSCIVGLLVGIWPVIPFTLAIVAITLIRFPINVYKTFKVALTSVVLKLNLRIMILLILPFAHILYPIIILIVGLVGSLGYFVGLSIVCVFNGEFWFQPWKQFPKFIKEFWKTHVEFSNETCIIYDHPTGIPLNWDGTMYGFPFGPMKVILGFILTIYGMIVCGFGTFIIITIKYIPMNGYASYHYFKGFFEQGWVKVVTLFPFFLIGFCFLVILSPVLYVLSILVGILAGLSCPHVGIKHDNLKYGFIQSFNILKAVDEGTKEFTACKIVLLYFYHEVKFNENRGTSSSSGSNAIVSETKEANPDFYWDLFTSRCIKETAALIQKKWILKDDVEAVDPSIVMSVPAVAVLSILVDSVKSGNEDKEAIVWGDDIVCTSSTRRKRDNILNLLWPRILEIKESLNKKPGLVEEENVDILTANICSNQDEQTDQLNEFFEGCEDNNSTENKDIRNKLIDLSLSLSRVRPMTDRLNKIVSHHYEEIIQPSQVGEDNSSTDTKKTI